MKRYIFSLFLTILSLGTFAQEDVTLFFLHDGSFKGFYDEEIDSITYSHLDLDSIWHNDAVVQEVWLTDSVVRIPIEDIDSICHKVPDPVYKPGVIHLDERYEPYITSVDGMSITFSPDLPNEMKPHLGDALIYDGSSDLFPDGFAGKVTSEGSTVNCEEPELSDVYEKIVFFGKYILINRGEEDKPLYSLRRINGRKPKKDFSTGDKDVDWKDGSVNITDIGTGTIKRSLSVELKKFHATLAADFSVTPKISLEFYWDNYLYKPYAFYKRTMNVDYVNKYYLKFSWDTKPDSDAKTSFWNSFWKGKEPEWFDTNYAIQEEDDGSMNIFVIDAEIPIPECPLLKTGVQLGPFIQPKFEGEVTIGLNTSGSYQKTFIYDSRDGDNGKEFDGPKTCEKEFMLEGSVKGSLWMGGIAALHINLGLGKGKKLEGLTEELKVRFGPYAEVELKANFSDAAVDRSNYTLLQDSKAKIGLKFGVDGEFTAKLGGGD